MNPIQTGNLIRTLRQRRGLTQKMLAEQIGVSDKAVSKWERGCGLPDPALLASLAEALNTDADALLRGELPLNHRASGKLKRCAFYVCPACNNLILSTDGARVHCCGRHLEPLKPQQENSDHELNIEKNDGEWLITSRHEMTREHHIAFVALIFDDTLLLRRLYPEWNLETRLPNFRRGTLLYYCTQHGLFTKALSASFTNSK